MIGAGGRFNVDTAIHHIDQIPRDELAEEFRLALMEVEASKRRARKIELIVRLHSDGDLWDAIT